ncbi:MAG: alpha-glucan family phosphorylase [Planctomycetes bacterium]|nr:alpha-glucan family phosphorylase [Planctomycetota bacterium]
MVMDLSHLRTLNVAPSIPDALHSLRDLAASWRFCWDREARSLWQRLDPALWHQVRGNPVAMLARLDQGTLEGAASDADFVRRIDAVATRFRDEGERTFAGMSDMDRDCRVAYFSAEFGISEALPIYSGGLGILAGDHLKSSSDLAFPLVGVGLLYREGYHIQRLGNDGWQREAYVDLDPYEVPIHSVRDADGLPRMVSVDLPEGPCFLRIWRADVGSVPLYLLDSRVLENPASHKQLTARLYGGDEHTRIRQEIVLGVGGVRALRAVGMEPTVYHMNEGHSAFLILERLRIAREEMGLSVEAAFEYVRSSTVFTTHTPVPAGNDRFTPAMMEEYFAAAGARGGFSMEELLALGSKGKGAIAGEFFEMTLLALRGSSLRNGVSKLHGEVTRDMYRSAWSSVMPEEVPVGSVTNGIHVETWLGKEIVRLYDQHLGMRWTDRQAEPETWKKLDGLEDKELWKARERSRERLIDIVRERYRAQLVRLRASATELEEAANILDPEALTIGFARRFAPYKRATLLMGDLHRLANLLGNPDRPVQIIFAGKAHPRNDEGKENLRDVFLAAQRPELRRNIVVLEDYDIELGAALVQGCDIWLNTPRRPLEASGTSGMKSVLNGGIHVSILDGWWCEGYRPERGWAIGTGHEGLDAEDMDRHDREHLFDILEREIVPTFYLRNDSGIPTEWVRKIRNSIQGLVPEFNTHRMVSDYAREYYLPAHRRTQELLRDGAKGAQEFAAWRASIRARFEDVKIVRLDPEVPPQGLTVGTELVIEAIVEPGDLKPEEYRVEAFLGPVDSDLQIQQGQAIPMEPLGTTPEGTRRFSVAHRLERGGRIAYAVRLLPMHPMLPNFAELNLVKWAEAKRT